jgi:hypothetical protein
VAEEAGLLVDENMDIALEGIDLELGEGGRWWLRMKTVDEDN